MIDPSSLCMHCMNPAVDKNGVCGVCGTNSSIVENKAHQLECGSILAGTYLVGEALGQGGFGITYLGFDLNLNIKVAIKEYYPEGCVTRDTHTHVSVLTFAGEKEEYFQKGKERFVEEARILARFSADSGVVGVRTFFFENGTAYIVMDFVEGETLKSYAAKSGGKLPSAEVLTLFKPLIKSLIRVHDHNLLHRDISPDNIMIRPDGTLALLDFGAARQFSTMGEHSNTINVKHGFAPEEQYRTRGEQGPWTDVYALCATIYRLTTGVTPTESLDRIINGSELTPPNQLGADFTPEQQSVIMHGLEVRASMRIQNMRILTEELYEGVSRHSGVVEKSTASNRTPKIDASQIKSAVCESGQSVIQQANQEEQHAWIRKAWPYIAISLVCVAIAAVVILATPPTTPVDESETTSAIVATITPEENDVEATPTDVIFSGEAIRIGLVSPNTGALATYGEAANHAVDLALEEINADGGILGRKVIVIKKDDEFDTTKAVEAFDSLVSQGVGLVIGSITSGCTAAMTGAANDNGVVLITPSATADSINTADDYVFRACYADSSQGAIAAYCAKTAGFPEVGVVYCSEDSYSVGLYGAFSEAAKKYGLQLKTVQATNSLSITDYTKQFKAMADADVAFVYAPFYYDVVGRYLIPQARAAGYTGIIMGADGYDSAPDYASSDANLSAFNDVYWTNPFDPSDSDSLVQKFVTAYEAKCGSKPNFVAALAYDAVYMLKQAIEKAGTDAPADVRAALADITTVYSRVTGNFSLDETGTPIKGASIISFSSNGISVTTKLVVVIRNLPD